MSERSSGSAPPMTLRSMVLKKLRKENLRVVRARTAASDRFSNAMRLMLRVTLHRLTGFEQAESHLWL